ncbi:MAG: prenyltransferase/squalene oxidase repeat-containing protein, partial [Polyangiales bacterium]
DPKGGWTFAGVWHGWPVSDCTAEAILAMLEAPEHRPSRAMVEDAVRFILKRQNADGGFGSYEAKRPRRIELEWLNPAEMFGDSMTEHSYLECTVSCLTALVRVREHFPDVTPRAIDRAVERAARFAREAQHDDGKWPTAWGVGYIYATMFGVRGLLAAGATPDDPAVRKACRWLLERQLPDGSWGESHEGCLRNEWVSMDHGHPIQTAWALTTLLEAREPSEAPLERAAAWLAAEQRDDGEWPEREMVGIFFHTALLHYRHYKRYFPVWALGLYEQHSKRYEASRGADERTAATATAPAE